jgi:hypothetical protein
MYFLKSTDLFMMRSAMIFWISLSLWPVEYFFDNIEEEIERRGHRV